jgi:hypothetical protein
VASGSLTGKAERWPRKTATISVAQELQTVEPITVAPQ